MAGGTEIVRGLARAAARLPSRRRKRPIVPRRPEDGGASEPTSVTPDRPLDLSGGAAAPLAFDD